MSFREVILLLGSALYKNKGTFIGKVKFAQFYQFSTIIDRFDDAIK